MDDINVEIVTHNNEVSLDFVDLDKIISNAVSVHNLDNASHPDILDIIELKADTAATYTKTETDALLDEKEPLRSVGENYVTDAQLTTLSNTSGTNTGDETNSAILAKIGYTPEDTANKATSFSSPTDTQYPSAKLVSDELALKANANETPVISSGSGAPSSTPSKVGDIYVDTSNYKTYISKGTSSSADWIKQNGSYALSCGFTTNNPPASSTLYFGQCNDSYNDAATRRKIYPQRAGKISAVAGEFVNVASSSEKSSLYIRVNNTTDYLISSTIATDTNSNYFSNNALSVPIADGDFFELKLVTPAWAQAPASCRSFISVYVDL